MPPFNERLRKLRSSAGLTQEQLALACGWSGQSRVANYEAPRDRKGARDPAFDELPLLAKALGVTIAELFTDTPPNAGADRDHRSIPMRLDPAMLSTAYKVAAAAWFAQTGKDLNLTKKRDAQVLADAYAMVEEHDGLPSREITSAFETVVRQSAKTGGSHGTAASPAKPHRTRKQR